MSSDHKNEKWAEMLGPDRLRWYRKVRKCRMLRLEFAKRSTLYDFIARVERMREQHGMVPVDLRNKTIRAKKKLGFQASEEDILRLEFDGDESSEEEEEVEETWYSCVDCTSRHPLDENFQCPGCGQDYCHDCVDLEKDCNRESVCNRCLDRDLVKCSVCRLDHHHEDAWLCPGCSTCYCDDCTHKKDPMTKTCDSCSECLCRSCKSTKNCALCRKQPHVIDLVDSA